MSRLPLALAVAGLVVLPAAASAADSADVTVIGTQTAIHVKGKVANFTETLRIGRKVVGADAISCTLVSGQSIFRCRGVYTFSNGTVTVNGTIDQSKVNNQIAISRGTGSYAGATGVVRLHDIGKTVRTQETFHFAS